MTKREAIQQLFALDIPYMELINGQCSPEATRRSMSEPLFAYATPRFGGEILVVATDPQKIDALERQGWEIIRLPTTGYASLRGFDPELEELPAAPSQTPMTLVVACETGTVDIHATARRYVTRSTQPLIAGGSAGARTDLLRELRQHVEAICPEFSRGQAETQIRLLANAVFVQAAPHDFHGYAAHEAYR